MAAPTIGVLFFVFICWRRFKGAAMQIQLDDIAGGKRLLWQGGEEEFVDDARTRDAHWALLLASGMSCHDHAAPYALRPHRHVWTVVEAAGDLAFWALLGLIGGQMQTRLDKRMIEHRVLFASCHESETREIGEHGPRTILAIEPRASRALSGTGSPQGSDQWPREPDAIPLSSVRCLDCQTCRATGNCGLADYGAR